MVALMRHRAAVLTRKLVEPIDTQLAVKVNLMRAFRVAQMPVNWYQQVNATTGAYRAWDSVSVVSAINAASSVSAVQTAMAPFNTAYGVTVRFPTTSGSSSGVTWNGLPSAYLPQVKACAIYTVQEFAKYPTQHVLDSTFTDIYWLYTPDDAQRWTPTTNFAQRAGAILFFSVRPDSETDGDNWRRVVHHEFQHVRDATWPTDVTAQQTQWQGANALAYGTTYTGGGSHPPSFIDQYALTNYTEDRAQVHAALMAQPRYAQVVGWIGGMTNDSLAAPTAVSAVAMGSGRQRVMWTVPAGDVNGVCIRRNGVIIATLTGTTTAAHLDTPTKKEIAQEIVCTAENSSLDWRAQYGYLEDIGDGRGYTGGIIGFTSGTNDMLVLVQLYNTRKPNNVLTPYTQALTNVNGTDSHAGLGTPFETAWANAALDQVFRTCQDDERDRVYFNPAVVAGKADGIRGLGQFIYYDTYVNHGPGTDQDSFDGIRTLAKSRATHPAIGGNETTYLLAFIQARKESLQRWGYTEFTRTEAQVSFVNAGKMDLIPPLSWNMYGDPFTIAGQPWVDTTSVVGGTYSYTVAAINSQNIEGAQSAATGGGSTPPPEVPGLRDVATAAQLQTALAAALPGDTIRLAPGTYTGQFVATRSGASAAPIILEGPRTAILTTGSTSLGYALHMDNVDYWTVKGFTLKTSKKAIMCDETTRCIFDSLEWFDIGEEGHHVRNLSSDNVMKNCWSHGTGVLNPQFGEAFYCGTHPAGWSEALSRTAGQPDRSNYNQYLDNTISACTAECFDVKEGTTGTTIRSNTCNGSNISGLNSAGSWMQCLGNEALIELNTFTQTGGVLVHGIEIQENSPGWGLRNVVKGNSFHNPIGYCVYATSIETANPNNQVWDNNTVTGTNTGVSNLALTPASGTTATYPAEVLNLINWKITAPYDTTAISGSPDEIKQPQLATWKDDNGDTHEFKVVSGAPNWVMFRAGVAGTSTTPNSSYPRYELRERTNNGTVEASWRTDSGTHDMVIIQKIMQLPPAKPHVVAGQIHDSADDVAMCRLEGTRLFVEAEGVDVGALNANYTLGTEFKVRFLATGGQIRMYYNDVLKVTLARTRSGCYFKAGCYTQSNLSKGETNSAYGEVQIRVLTVIHT